MIGNNLVQSMAKIQFIHNANWVLVAGGVNHMPFSSLGRLFRLVGTR